MFWKNTLFCSTGLPLARTWLVGSTFSSHYILSSKQHHWLTSAPSIIFPLIKYWECWESNPPMLGEKQVCYLCAMQPPLHFFSPNAGWTFLPSASFKEETSRCFFHLLSPARVVSVSLGSLQSSALFINLLFSWLLLIHFSLWLRSTLKEFGRLDFLSAASLPEVGLWL